VKLTLPDDVIRPLHAVQLTSSQFIVCHGGFDDAVHRVCTISADGQETVRAHGGQPGSNTGQYNGPFHLAVDDNEYVFVADFDNCRVTILSPTLDFVRHVVSPDKLNWWTQFLGHFVSLDKLKWKPLRLHLDVQRRRLYVASGRYTGRVVVYSV